MGCLPASIVLAQKASGTRSSRNRHDDFYRVFGHNPAAAFRSVPSGRLVAFNDAFMRMLGFARRRDLSRLHLSTLQRVPGLTWDEFRRRLSADGVLRHVETYWSRPGGAPLITETTVWAVRDEDGSVGYFEGWIKDITSRKADEALRTFGTVFEHIPVGFAQLDFDGSFLDVNAAFRRKTGFSDRMLLKMTYESLTHPEDRDRDLRLFSELVRGARDHYKVEKRYRRKSGGFFWVNETMSLVRDAHRRPRFLNAVVVDITERKEAELGLRQRTVELEAANRELESFAYTVSHDLRTPLRGIEGFASLLEAEQQSRLDPEGRRLLKRIRAATARMAQLIDDLLNLAKTTRKELALEDVDLSKAAQQVMRQLRRDHRRRRADVVIEDGMEAHGDAALLRDALENLLGNAWKFTSNKPRTRIEFGVRRSKAGPVYYVKDNGAGFDMAYADRLFRPFNRLHHPSEFEGNGIGLATVQRIVERHGGKVWAQARPGRGATFFFTLPRRIPR